MPLKIAPEPDWNKIWATMQELGAAIAPLLEMDSLPSWAMDLQFIIDIAVRDVEPRCLRLEARDE